MPERTRAEKMLDGMRENHLPRIVEGIESGYVDENQILVLFDHAVRYRILKQREADDAKPTTEAVLRQANEELLQALAQALSYCNWCSGTGVNPNNPSLTCPICRLYRSTYEKHLNEMRRHV